MAKHKLMVVLDDKENARLRRWLKLTGRDAYGALGAELRRMVREGLDRREAAAEEMGGEA